MKNTAPRFCWFRPGGDMKARRLTLAASLAAVILVGILSRTLQTGFVLIDKYLGDALYTIMFYLLLSLVWLRGSAMLKAGIVMVFMIVLELFQLTLIPYHLSASSNIFLRIAAILLGTRFSWWDLLAYLVGVILIVSIDSLVFSKRA
jgi:hypothetical protein